jgi:hypothetical protein
MKKITNKELLALIGEIDGITLRLQDGITCVFINLLGKEIRVITDASVNMDNHITRIGISDEIMYAFHPSIKPNIKVKDE